MEKQTNQRLKVAQVQFTRLGSDRTRTVSVHYRYPAQLAELLHRKVIPELGHVDVTGVTDQTNGIKWGVWNPYWAHEVFDNGRFKTSLLLHALSAECNK